ncbi:MAG: ABC transporter ATP-binding protein [Deltaproteobacteria bacterium]|nr:ABC transporter ATP-binding protein [Deltaproteobacteria bacterium]
MLSVRDLVTSYGRIEALRGISLDAAEGEITCLLGPNGAGKTTTLFTIAGILEAQSGSVVLDGEDLTRLPAAKVVSRGIALVPENRLVFPGMDVEENLRAGAYSRRASAAEVAADVAEMYRRFPRLEERRHQPAGTLSGGEQQMLAIARGLMARPRILLMDEPSIGLAPMIVAEIFDIIRELNAEGVTILLVEQNARMALEVAHKFYLIEGGRITFSGSPGEIEQDEVIHRAYLGSRRG